MERRLPSQYTGWETHEPAMRRLSVPELVMEIQDGAPDRRLAALSVIDLTDVAQSTIEDWVRTLPDAEANELAGAIPALRTQSDCDEEMRWMRIARMGHEYRRLPTFLVMLMSTLEALEAKSCPQVQDAWDETATWLGRTFDRLVSENDDEALEDLSLFVFECYLDRGPMFEQFCKLLARHESFAWSVSANPSLLLGELPESRQRTALLEAERGGGLPFQDSWAALRGR